jgi:hypothetical protein
MKEDYAVLIPTRSRPVTLSDMFRRNPQLNRPTTFVAIENREMDLYDLWHRTFGARATIVLLDNPDGYAGNAREVLRLATKGRFQRYFLTDDNARFSPKSFEILLEAQSLEGCIMSGLGQPELWYKDAIAVGANYETALGKITTFTSYSVVHWIIPAALYDRFIYPPDIMFDDNYFALWCILREKYTTFRGCLQAKYSKKRFEPGGHGDGAERLAKMGTGMIQLARYFPEAAGPEWMREHIPRRTLAERIREEQHA